MTDVLLRNFALLDVEAGELRSGHQVLVKDGRIAEVRRGAIEAKGAEPIDLGGRTLMPGLIDCHIHVTLPALGGVIGAGYPKLLPSLVHASVGQVLRDTLLRGFTTVRDCAGADVGHKQAVEQGFYVGPRLFVAGKALSQTGGHGDARMQSDQRAPATDSNFGVPVGRLADGVPEVQRAARDEIRMGADQIKLMAGGGVGSAADPLDHLQYSEAEIIAVVDEAARAHKYVQAHAYTSEAIERCVRLGVRTIEHGNFLDESTAALMARAGAYLVPTLICYSASIEHGVALGRPAWALEKGRQVLAVGGRSLEIARRAGVKMAFGTDICFLPIVHLQNEEFRVRAAALPAADILRSATLIGAEVVGLKGRAGVIAPGAYADLLALDGDPLADVTLLGGEGAKIAAIMKEGRFYKNRIAASEADTATAVGLRAGKI